MDYRFKTEPYEHQLKALGCSWNKIDFAYFMEMGTGKTKVCIDNIAMLYDKGHIDSALVIAPKGVYHNWKNQELPIHLPEHINANIVCWTPTPNKKEQAALDSLFVINDNLTIFLMNIEAFSTSKGYEFAYKFLLGHRSLMAIDESTTIKAPTASRTKNVLKLRSLAKYRRILTGSPVTKSPLDLYTQCYFLDPDLLDFSSYWTFKTRYALMANRRAAGGAHSYSHVIKYIRLDELNKKLDKFSTRVLKEDCLDLPDKVYMKRIVTLTPEQLKAYYEMKKFAIAELADGTMTAFSALTQIMRLHQITCGHVTTDDGKVKELKSNRLSELLNILEETNDKIIIWANYRYDIQNITRTLQKKYGAESTASLYGDTHMADRDQIISDFQDKNSDLRYLVSNPKTGGYGLTLTASHTVIYYSNSYDLEVRLQSEDRAHRIGQTSKVTYIDLIAEKTVDEQIVKSLRGKINIATQVLGEDLKKWLI
tara:strand:- start:2068 stop:3510 length:1443 start_codon:yes stop_codon:yes gene_type:complete